MNLPHHVPRKTLTDGWIHIRPVGPEDTVEFYAAFLESWPTLRLWMNWGEEIRDIRSAQAHLELKADEWRRGEAYSFLVESEDCRFLGMCGLSQFNWRHRFANVGYWVRPSQRGKAVMPAAVRVLARFAFGELKLHRIELLIEPSNLASRRAAEKSGARFEGQLRGRICNQGLARDALMFSLVPEDVDSRSGAHSET
ncbi:MAG: GNAT family N-acetyltransferase [Verrucomicrobia bacterium]|nr:GNAT family N-acetyltransferase [Verrucomicrobiota bacterium]